MAKVNNSVKDSLFQIGGRFAKRRRRLQDWFPDLSEVTELDYWQQEEQVEWIPCVDVTDGGTEYILKAELTGVKKEDIKLTLENDILWLRGERRPEPRDQYHLCSEWLYGCFSRKFRLPAGIKEKEIRGCLENAILTVVLPKDSKRQPREIKID